MARGVQPLEVPPEVARRLFEDVSAFHRERNPIKRDETDRHTLLTSLTERRMEWP